MSRTNDVYSVPPGTTATPNTTISSAAYNAFVADIATDQNNARPLIAGGTGSNTAIGASDKLSTTSTDMASATTLNLANATGVVVNVTGTTTIIGLGTVSSGALRVLVFSGILTLTHNATSLILPSGANITTAAGDVATFRSKGSGNWVCVGYQRASGASLVTFSNASETVAGVIEIATAVENAAMSSNVLAVTPGRLKDSLAWYAITYAATIPVDHQNGVNQKVTLTGNGAFGAPSNGIPGATLDLWIVQDGTGTRVPTWNAVYDFGDYGTPVLSTGVSQADIVSFKCLTASKYAFYGIRRRVD